MNDIDELLREFRSTLDEPPPGALERARSRAMGGVGQRAVRRWGRWLALPATAVGVSAAAVTASLMLGHTPAIVAETTAQPAISVTTTPPTTAELIEAWARDLEAGPLPPPAVPGQLILPSLRRFADGRWIEQPVGHMTVERAGLLVVDNAEFRDRDSFQAYVAQQRSWFAEFGPSWGYPTAEWLDALDPSPASLLATIQPFACGGKCVFDKMWILDSVRSLMVKGEIVLPPRIRAGLLRLLGTLDGVTAYEDTVDGRPVRVVSLPETFEPRLGLTLSYYRVELYIDPALNRFVGSGTVMTGRAPDLPQCAGLGTIDVSATLRPRPTDDECFEVTPLDEPERVLITLWEQTLVTP